MNKFAKYLIFAVVLLTANTAFAAEPGAYDLLGKGIGVGLGVLGAGLGIGKIGESVLDAISRNPSAAGKMNVPFFVGVALIEGALILGIVLGLSN